MQILRGLGTLIIAGFIAPAGLVLGQTAPNLARTTVSAASKADPVTTTGKTTFSQIQDLAQNIRREVGPLKFDTVGTSVTWKFHTDRLARVKQDVNKMEKDVNKLEARKNTLPAWQQELLNDVEQDSHEVVYQTSEAIKTLNANHNTTVLATTRYPQYIDIISQKANDAAGSIGTVFQRHGVDMD